MKLERIHFKSAVWLPDSSGTWRGKTTFPTDDSPADAEAHLVGEWVVIRHRGALYFCHSTNVTTALPVQSEARTWLAYAQKPAEGTAVPAKKAAKPKAEPATEPQS